MAQIFVLLKPLNILFSFSSINTAAYPPASIILACQASDIKQYKNLRNKEIWTNLFKSSMPYLFKNEGQTALFKSPVRTAL
jgi:hypothetical protein